jgi:hypothetical protein
MRSWAVTRSLFTVSHMNWSASGKNIELIFLLFCLLHQVEAITFRQILVERLCCFTFWDAAQITKIRLFWPACDELKKRRRAIWMNVPSCPKQKRNYGAKGLRAALDVRGGMKRKISQADRFWYRYYGINLIGRFGDRGVLRSEP